MKTASRSPRKLSDLYGGGEKGTLLDGRFHTDQVYAWFQKRHRRARQLIDDDGYYVHGDHSWKVPYGVKYAISQPLVHSQIANKYPWYVTWSSPRTRKRYRKYFTSIVSAMHFVATKAQYVDKHATIVSRHGYDIPPQLRGKLPGNWKWCPGCMKPRKYRRQYQLSGDPQTFFAYRKEWNRDKLRYEFRDRKLALMACPICGLTNRDHKFRRSNQPWEKITIERGRTRTRRRR